jgi:hypothetical protein
LLVEILAQVAGLSYADHDERMQMHEYARVCALERAKRGRIAPIEMWTNYNNQSRSMASGRYITSSLDTFD